MTRRGGVVFKMFRCYVQNYLSSRKPSNSCIIKAMRLDGVGRGGARAQTVYGVRKSSASITRDPGHLMMTWWSMLPIGHVSLAPENEAWGTWVQRRLPSYQKVALCFVCGCNKWTLPKFLFPGGSIKNVFIVSFPEGHLLPEGVGHFPGKKDHGNLKF